LTDVVPCGIITYMKKKDNNMKKAFVFDFDDTLATTDCKVLVRRVDGSHYKRLTPAEFNTFELGKFGRFDFSEFASAEFIHNANPTKLIDFAKEVHDEGHAVYVLTARADNVADAITDWLCGFDVQPVHVYGVGRDDKKCDIAAEKQKVLTTLKQVFDVVYFYDDDQHNIDLANQIGIKTYLV
jgi:FMN phosphatase YigB (HAD superfamily)